LVQAMSNEYTAKLTARDFHPLRFQRWASPTSTRGWLAGPAPPGWFMASARRLPFDQIEVGQSLSVSRTVSRPDLEALTFVSGDIDSSQLAVAQPDLVPSAESVAAEAFFSYLLNRRLPGPGTTILAHDLSFRHQIALGDTMTATVTAREKKDQGHVIVFDCLCVNQHGDRVAEGTATVAAPTESIAYSEIATPEVIFRRSDLLGRLIKACEGLPPVTGRRASL
jgi:acyl dehydratase